MKSFDVEKFPNLLDNINLTHETIEESIKEYSLEFSSVRNQQVEWKISFPMFATSFYKYTFFKHKIPTQKEFYDYYVSSNKEFFTTRNFSEDIMIGLKARVYRTYPSLVRDIHFSKTLHDKLKDYKVIYNTKLDINEGIDVMIIKEDEYYGVNLFTNTTRAKSSRDKKSKRHSNFTNVNYIDLPVNFNGSLKCGDFFLYGEEEMTQLLNKMKSFSLI
jgi:hypothetical protein